jgi:hypothetical protein
MGQPREDFLLDKTGDFPLEDTIVNGIYQETPYGSSDHQHVRDIIFDGQGATKSYPIIGFAIKRYLNSEYNLYTVEKELSYHLGLDGYGIKTGAVIPNAATKGFDINTAYIYIK